MNKTSNTNVVGRVVGLFRYPVKSMAPEPLETVRVSWFGLAGDRRWAFVRDEAKQSGFPWLTIRERNDLNHYQPSFADPSKPETSPTIVRTPSGKEFDVADPALSAELYPSGTRAIRQHRGIFDTFPLSLITTQTIARLGEDVGIDLDVQRFRPNLLVEANGDTEFPEDEWVGCTLCIGTLRMRVDKRDGRCVIITIDPTTMEKKPEILRAVAADRDGCLGVYGTTVQPGQVTLNDEVALEYFD